MQQEFQTARLQIRPLDHSDSDFMFKLLNSASWIQFIGDRKVRNTEDARLYIARIVNDPKVHYFVLEEKRNRQPVGILTLIQRTELPYPDFGFALLPEYEGKGFAFEAADCFLRRLAQTVDKIELLAITLPANTASRKLLEKLNFRLDTLREVKDEVLAIYRLSELTGLDSAQDQA